MKRSAFTGLCCLFLFFLSMVAASGSPGNAEGKGKQIAVINPAKVYLRGEVGREIKASVKVVPEQEGSFEIVRAEATDGKNIQFTLTETEESGKKVYFLTVKNMKKTPGRYEDTINLVTRSELQEKIKIPVQGNIWPAKVVSISPRSLVLKGSLGKPVKASVEIVPNAQYPFVITEVLAYKGDEIKWDLQEVDKSGKRTYILNVESLRKKKGVYNDVILLKTDSKYLPKIYITVSVQLSD